MRPNEIDARIRQRPFVPFRLHLSDGSSYDVRHPEMAIAPRTVITVAICENGEDELPDRVISCDPVHVTRIEPIGEDSGVG